MLMCPFQPAPAAQPVTAPPPPPVVVAAPPAVAYPPPPSLPPRQRPNYALVGTALGALAGGIIGHQEGEALAGAVIGGVAGLAVGGIAENETRRAQQRRLAAPAPAWVTPANYGPQVPDAPLAPLAPTIP